MHINRLELTDFKAIQSADINFEGKSSIIFGINGTGKSTILRSVNLLYANIINQIVNRKELKQYYAIQLEDIRYRAKETQIRAEFDINGENIEYGRRMVRSTGKKYENKDGIKRISDIFHDEYVSDEIQGDIPIFANYGTNRLVLDIPLRIRIHHTFDIYSSLEKAIENKIDFRTFFEWYRNQEDYENEKKIELGNLNYKDKSLEAVRVAIASMLDECTNLRVVRKPRLEMKIDKGDISVNVSQMSDGEKCTMALFGDLARRLTLANPNKVNPLMGKGVVLIDEIELHMHPSWQRKVLRKLKDTFPNIQFIITTHSPIVLSEADDDYKLFYTHMTDNGVDVEPVGRMDGYDTSAVLEQFMGTKSINEKTERYIHLMYKDIQNGNYAEAKEKVDELASMTSENHPDVIMARMELKRRNG